MGDGAIDPDRVARRLGSVLQTLLASDVDELIVEDAERRVRVHRRRDGVFQMPLQPQPGLTADLGSELPRRADVTSPLVGTFYRAGAPGMDPLVQEGSRVEVDTVVGIIESLQVLTDVEAGCRGTVTAVLATDGQPVEYGQVLFEVAVDG